MSESPRCNYLVSELQTFKRRFSKTIQFDFCLCILADNLLDSVETSSSQNSFSFQFRLDLFPLFQL